MEKEVKQNIATRVIELIVAQLGVDKNEVVLESNLVEDLGADSLSKVNLILGCEDTFRITIPEENDAKINTVGDLVDCVCKALDD